MGQIKANLHGHLLADFGPWWRKQFGLEDKNLAIVAVDKCISEGLGIYAITNDPFWNFEEKSRFNYMWDYAQESSRKGIYKVGQLGKNAFVMEKNNKKIHFLNGKSLRLKDDGREYELLTFGSSNIPDGMSFPDTSSYLHDNGYLGFLEHPFAEGHHGKMDEEKVLELWSKEYIDGGRT